jgi:ABC-type multidrug transport system fused ATPase/permease subunit
MSGEKGPGISAMLSPGGTVGPDWHNLQGKWVAVHAPQGTYAAKRAPLLLREAEQVADAVERLLKPDKHSDGKADIFLLDPTAGLIEMGEEGEEPEVQGYAASFMTPTADAGRSIVRVVRPEAPGETIAHSLSHLLLTKWLGASAGSSPLFTSGIAGVANARAGLGESIQACDEWVRAELAAGRPVSVLRAARQEDRDGGSITASEADKRIATSFVNYLIETFGVGSLRQFLAGYDPDRRDQAAINAYQKPMGALEEAWVNTLRRSSSSTSIWGSFLRHIIPLLRPYRLRQLEVLLYMFLGLSYGIVLPLSGKYLIDTVIPSNDLGQLGLFVLGLLVLYVVNALVGMRRGYLTSWINQELIKRLDERLFAHLQRLPHTFFAQIKVGDIMTRFTSDMAMVQNAIQQVTSTGPFMVLTGLLAATTVIILSPILGSLVLLIVPLFLITYVTLGSRLQKASTQRQKILGEVISSLQENVSAHAVVKAYGLEKKSLSMFRTGLEALQKASLRTTKIAVLFETSTGLSVTLGQLMVLGVGGYLVMQSQLTIGTLLAFVGLLPSLIQPIMSLSGIGQTVKTASGAINRVTDLLEEPVTVDDKPAAVDLPTLSREIRLEAVGFSYGSGNPILNGLSLTIPTGANVAIVGPSGSGKSTIVSLLMRFYDPEQGSILFDDHDLRDVKLASLRSQIGLVFQDTFIFDTTVRENIAHGRPGATDVEIVAAAKAAQLHEFIEALPSGYDTVLGERGVRMSGGQRQRLAIARALIRDPRILVLDEATSALDSHTEREILDTLDDVAKGRTVISITHRLAIAAAADYIFVLEQGRLVEEGNHANLVKAGGLYSRLYAEQTSGVALPDGSSVALDQLRTVPLFGGFADPLLASLARKMVRERFFVDEDVVREGEPGDKLYVVQRGGLEVMIGAQGEERKVNSLHPGEYFGEMALLTGEPRGATVRATEPTEVFSLSRMDFLNLVEQEEALRTSVQNTLESRRKALDLVRAGGVQPQAQRSR